MIDFYVPRYRDELISRLTGLYPNDKGKFNRWSLIRLKACYINVMKKKRGDNGGMD